MYKDSLSPLSLPDFSGVDGVILMEALRKCEEGKGEEVLLDFVSEFCKLTDTKYCIPVSSATSGIHLALIALGVTERDIVICPTFTFAASAFPVLYQKAHPVFIDSEMETWNMSSEYLEEALKYFELKNKRPAAIVVVHGYGTPARISEIMKLAEKYEIPVVEDAANALGSHYQGRQTGTIGKIGVFSFNRNKIISAGAGGCVVTDDKNLAEKVKYFANQAKTHAPYYLHENVGHNYGMSPVLAEVIRQQLITLPSRVKARRDYFFNLTDKSFTGTFQKETEGAFANRWITVLKTPPEASSAYPDRRNVWKPLHTQPVFSGAAYFGNQESKDFFENGFCIPYRKEQNNL